MTSGTIFAGIVMTAAVVALVKFGSFIGRDISNALNQAFGEFGDSDARTAALRNALDEGVGDPGRNSERGGGAGCPGLQGGNDASQITGPQSHFRTREK